MSNENQENLRTEYSALSHYYNSLVTFRLTLLGFFLAALSFIIGDAWPIRWQICALGLLLTFCMYIFELRTRVLFEAIGMRGKEIEQSEWKFESKALTKRPFYNLQYPDQEIPNYGIKLKIFGKIPIEKVPILNQIRISHSFALDCLYIGLICFFLLALTVSVPTLLQPTQTQLPTPIATVASISTTPSATLSPTVIATSTVKSIPTIIVTAIGTP